MSQFVQTFLRNFEVGLCISSEFSLKNGLIAAVFCCSPYLNELLMMYDRILFFIFISNSITSFNVIGVNYHWNQSYTKTPMADYS